jgi:pyruvate-formate lyase-activating enzyme
MIIDPLPKTIAIEISSACALACSYCERNTWAERGLKRETEHIAPELFHAIVDEISLWRRRPSLVISYEGESTLHPEFNDLLGYAHEKGFRSWLTTSLLGRKSISWSEVLKCCSTVCVSLDGPRRNFALRRGTVDQYDQVVSRLTELISERDRHGYPAQIAVSTVIDGPGSPELAEFASEWTGRVDEIYGWFETVGEGNSLRTRIPIDFPMEKRCRCAQPFDYLAVLSDGFISPCCASSRTRLPIHAGYGLATAWRNPAYVEFRHRHATLDLGNTPCKECMLWPEGWMPDQPWRDHSGECDAVGLVMGHSVLINGKQRVLT